MPKISSLALKRLQDAHERYRHYNQHERADHHLMAALGHPHAGGYREARRFFDRLKYACNASARLFTYRADSECATFWAPELDLSWRPEGPLSRFGHIYPASNAWDEYIAAAAAAKWKGAMPKHTHAYGTWHIHTVSDELRQALKGMLRTGGARGDEPTSYARYFSIQPTSLKQHRQLVALLRQHQGEYVLPARTAADKAADTQAVALADKPLMLAKVPEVKVTDHHVLVPLVPLGEKGPAVALPAAQRIVELLREGWSWAQACPWLKSQLQPGAFAALAATFQPAAAAPSASPAKG